MRWNSFQCYSNLQPQYLQTLYFLRRFQFQLPRRYKCCKAVRATSVDYPAANPDKCPSLSTSIRQFPETAQYFVIIS